MGKKKIVYLLPHNETYELVDSFHTGGMEGEGFLPCDNCNKLISRIAVIHAKESNKRYHVGFDCAATLTSIKEETLKNHLDMFKLGSSIRTSLLNRLKEISVGIVTIEERPDNQVVLYLNSNNNARLYFAKIINKGELYDKYIYPQIKDLQGAYIGKNRTLVEDLRTRLEDFCNMVIQREDHLEINKHSYHQEIVSVDRVEPIENSNVSLLNIYMKNGSRSIAPIMKVYADAMATLRKEAIEKANITYHKL